MKSIVMQPERRAVQVIIYSHTGLADVRACLEAALRSFSGRDFIIVLESGSDSDVRSYLTHFASKYGSVLMENYDDLGYAKSVIKGFDRSRAEYLVVLDASITSPANGLRALVECLRRDESLDAVLPLTRQRLLAAMKKAVGPNPVVARFIADASLELLATAVENSDLSVVSLRTVSKFVGYSCFALRRSASRKLASWRYNDEMQSEPLHLELTGSCCIDDPRSMSDYELRDAFDMAALRSAFESFQYVLLKAASLPVVLRTSVLFLLPKRGAFSIAQEILALRDCGMNAMAAAGSIGSREIMRNFPDASEFCIACDDEDQLAELGARFDIIVATDAESAGMLVTALRQARHVIPMYYLQEYEPWAADDDVSQAEAERILDGPGSLQFLGCSQWLCRTMRQRHRIEVTRIPLGVDAGSYAHFERKTLDASQPLMIASFIRTGEPRGNARNAMRILRKVGVKHGRRVDIRVFGCTDEELDQMDEARGFRLRNLSILNRQETADVLRGADIFADLSIGRAVARLGLEAMAAGCATILPDEGGAREFAVDGQNCLIVDTSQDGEAVKAFDRLIADRSLVERLKEQGMRTAQSHSSRKTAWAELQLFSESLCHAEQ